MNNQIKARVLQILVLRVGVREAVDQLFREFLVVPREAHEIQEERSLIHIRSSGKTRTFSSTVSSEARRKEAHALIVLADYLDDKEAAADADREALESEAYELYVAFCHADGITPRDAKILEARVEREFIAIAKAAREIHNRKETP